MQDLDGVSRADEVARVGAIARKLAPPTRELELLVLFHPLGRWLEKVGNLSRVLLTVKGVTQAELRRTAASIRRLDAPVSEAERAVAAAILIDGAGIRGLAERFARARREGISLEDVAREEVAEAPEWMSEEAKRMFEERRAARREFSARLLEELSS